MHEQCCQFRIVPSGQGFELPHDLRAKSPHPASRDGQDPSAPGCGHGRIGPDDEPVAPRRNAFALRKFQLDKGGLPGQSRVAPDHPHPARSFGSPHVKVHAVAMLHRRRRRKQRQLGVEQPRRFQDPRRRQHHASLDLAAFQPGQVERDPLPALGYLHRLVVNLYLPHPH